MLPFWPLGDIVPFTNMSKETLQSKVNSCESLITGVAACARVGGMDRFKGLSQEDLKKKLEERG